MNALDDCRAVMRMLRVECTQLRTRVADLEGDRAYMIAIEERDQFDDENIKLYAEITRLKAILSLDEADTLTRPPRALDAEAESTTENFAKKLDRLPKEIREMSGVPGDIKP